MEWTFNIQVQYLINCQNISKILLEETELKKKNHNKKKLSFSIQKCGEAEPTFKPKVKKKYSK